MQIQQGLRMIIYLFTGILTCIGLANIFASTLGQIYQRKREFARYFAVGLTPKGAAKILAWEAAIVALRPILLFAFQSKVSDINIRWDINPG